MSLINELDSLGEKLKESLAQAGTLPELEELRIAYMGRKGFLAGLMAKLKDLSAEERPAFGQKANEVKESLTALLDGRLRELKALHEDAGLASFDPSLPGRLPWQGSLHAVTLVTREICAIYERLGYDVVTGPEVETDFYNFEALNFPHDHPARDMQDTLFVGDKIVMRTHTSPVEVRTMLARKKPPVAIVSPGKVFRRDYDITHSPMFHQIEGLLVDENMSLCDLRGTLAYMCRSLFGQTVNVRFRPSFFPFTEPSAEVDISCIMCNGIGHIKGEPCRVCKATGWLEILGCGMTDPNVFAYSGFSRESNGFAFGLGVERVAMLKYGIGDLRLFFENDMRFLQQFA
ncbi:MAG: phenylalanine--tRNA ligase subunit alpha [Deltaproteobacteria bacterium]|jgi:phenylalanyl-tRNA synthetase alpha chain|nr:phenylalanine--tRNA ligase subunit alpha [Deltaproteobacteria bacterium]